MWVIQEFAVARHVDAMCGIKRVPESQFAKFAESYGFNTYFIWQKGFFKPEQDRQRRSLDFMLLYFCDFEATDPRD